MPRGHILDQSNLALGLAFYAAMLVQNLLPLTLVLAMSLGSLGFSLYLGVILKFVLGDFCLVCTALYVVNIVLFILVARRATRSWKVKEI